MKLQTIIIAGLGLIAANGQAQVVTDFKATAPVKVTRPIITDTVNPHGDKYKASLLLADHSSIDLKHRATSTLQADTAGLIALPSAESGEQVMILQATVRPERFAKGSLKVQSQAMLQTYLNGGKTAGKETVEDSIGAASTVTVPVTMQPQTENVLTIKVLLDTTAGRTLRVEYVADDKYKDVPVKMYAEGKRVYELRDMYLGHKASGTSISPDGKYMIVRHYERFSRDDSRSRSELMDLKTGAIINSSLPAGVAWMPKGSTLYRASKGESGYDVYAISLPSMAEKQIMSNVPTDRFGWSPAEDYIYYYDTDEGEPNNGPLRHYKHPDDRLAGSRTRSFLKMYDPATGQTTTLLYGNRQSGLRDITPDGKKMLISVSDYDATEWPFYFSNLYELDLATMKMDTLFTHDANISDATYSPDGKQLFITGTGDAFGGIGANYAPHPIANSSDMQGYIYDLATGKARAMTKDFNPSLTGSVNWNAATGNIFFQGENGFNKSLYQMNPATGKITEIPQEIENIQGYSIGNDESQWLAYYGQGKTTSGRAYLYNLKTGKQQLVAAPWEAETDVEWGKSEPWNFTSRNGDTIEGWLTYPVDFDPNKKYPMIVYYYGGTSPTVHNSYSPYNPQVFTSRGYVVYQINPSGTTGYGQEFAARHVNAWGDWTADDIIEGVKKLTAEKKFINKDKIGAIGASYGGFMTQYLMSLTDIFAAGVAHAGISNVTSYWGGGDWGYSYNALAASKSYPWNNPDLFTKHGSLFNADKIHTPLLLVHGAADNNVPPHESVQLFNALKILGRDVELIMVDDEDHFISKYDNRLAWQNSIMAFFAKYLQDDPRWWDEMYK